MPGWSFIVDMVRAVVFAGAHFFGGSIGSSILAISVVVRVALLPLTLRMARQAIAHQKRLAELKPELDRLAKRHEGNRAALSEATVQLYRERGISPLPPGMLSATLIQAPIGAALYRAFSTGLGPRLRFLWIADLARPDALLAVVAAALAAASAAIGATTPNRAAVIASATLTLVLAWRLSASVGLYWVASNAVGAGQAIILRRSQK